MALVLLLLWVVGLAMAPSSHAQNSQQDYLNAHNVAPGQVGVSNFTWDNTVAAYAQNYANSRNADCNLVRSGGPYGQNLAKDSCSFTAMAALNLWVAEKPYYNYTSNACTGGKQCLGSFTILKWFGKLL